MGRGRGGAGARQGQGQIFYFAKIYSVIYQTNRKALFHAIFTIKINDKLNEMEL